MENSTKVTKLKAFYQVLLVQKGKEKYAMKVMKITNVNMEDLANEKNVMQKTNSLKSPFLVKTHEFLQTNVGQVGSIFKIYLVFFK